MSKIAVAARDRNVAAQSAVPLGAQATYTSEMRAARKMYRLIRWCFRSRHLYDDLSQPSLRFGQPAFALT